MGTSLELGVLSSHQWEAANILLGPVDAADFKTYIFSMLFFKRISDVREEEPAAALLEFKGDDEAALFPENHRFQIPEDCHWRDVRQVTTNVGQALQAAMSGIEQANTQTLYGRFAVSGCDVDGDQIDEVVIEDGVGRGTCVYRRRLTILKWSGLHSSETLTVVPTIKRIKCTSFHGTLNIAGAYCEELKRHFLAYLLLCPPGNPLIPAGTSNGGISLSVIGPTTVAPRRLIEAPGLDIHRGNFLFQSRIAVISLVVLGAIIMLVVRRLAGIGKRKRAEPCY